MRKDQLLAAFVVGIFLPALLLADCPKNRDHRSDQSSGLLIADFIISGTRTLSSDDISRFTNQLKGACVNDDPDELGERIRALFQDHGYFRVEVRDLRIKPGDPLAVPKPAAVEAEIAEGPRYRVGRIEFTGNHAFTETKLRTEFRLRRGDWFERGKIAGGLEGVRKLYGSAGFIDFTVVPETQFGSEATVDLRLTVMEGPQYRMGKLEVFAKKEVADKLRVAWQLPEGKVFDRGYIDGFIAANRELLPEGFTPETVQVVRDCPDASVEVRLLLETAGGASLVRPNDIKCEPGDDKPR